ncbi:hypothetical protein YC2023_122601 [Brassica napus]
MIARSPTSTLQWFNWFIHPPVKPYVTQRNYHERGENKDVELRELSVFKRHFFEGDDKTPRFLHILKRDTSCKTLRFLQILDPYNTLRFTYLYRDFAINAAFYGPSKTSSSRYIN